ncbi:MAG TPA: hypothetical protein VMN60_08560 [Longimicrobiales bacterium]|nr:hypothetical protein [Longimicrobiales bacterium]
MPYEAIRYVSAWTTAVLRAEPARRAEGLTQCLWGDWVGVESLAATDGWLRVRTRGRSGWLREQDIGATRPLEVNFVDIGQGDGTFVVAPDDSMFIIDAGQGDNMHRFLRWRFNLSGSRQAPPIEAAVISHPDLDHYKGFQRIFADQRFRFNTVYHNGIVERAGGDALGASEVVDGQRYLTELVQDRDTLEQLLAEPERRGRKLYPKLMWTALESGRVADIRMAAAGDVIFATDENGTHLEMRVLAPVLEEVDGSPALRWFADKPGPTRSGNAGKTKNGHSVVTMLQYGNVRILLGGDLNIPAEEYLMAHYGHDTTEFQADVAKACHHGSPDFSTQFLDLVNPVATVISSGDDEPHGHPRADTLGTVGKHSRGERSLIFSTELARSAPERITSATRARAAILRLLDNVVEAADDVARSTARGKFTEHLAKVVQRSVSMYGLITLRTDGTRAILAQRLERARSKTQKWDVYELKPDGNGTLSYTSPHH